jgi:GR25 family glycosyltransferase involved in LPS biosynthesis
MLRAATLAEKACFFSHRSLLKSKLDRLDPVLVVEDDVLIHENTLRITDTMLPAFSTFEWDIIYLDICVPDIKTMIDLYSQISVTWYQLHKSLGRLSVFAATKGGIPKPGYLVTPCFIGGLEAAMRSLALVRVAAAGIPHHDAAGK